MERLRIEREEWEVECGREREKRESYEDDLRSLERRERELKKECERMRDEVDGERQRGNNLQEVLSEFQACTCSFHSLTLQDLSVKQKETEADFNQ